MRVSTYLCPRCHEAVGLHTASDRFRCQTCGYVDELSALIPERNLRVMMGGGGGVPALGPGEVRDFLITMDIPSGNKQATFSFTMPGFNGVLPDTYEIRYSATDITSDAIWNAASFANPGGTGPWSSVALNVMGVPVGGQASYFNPNIFVAGTYYFASRFKSLAGVVGPISNRSVGVYL